MYKHTTDEIVMIRPEKFYGNEETAVNNAYQNTSDESVDSIQNKAIKEFDDLVKMLEAKGVKVNVIQDTPSPSTPDSIFPNNWFSTHEGGIMAVYPMFAQNRQEEIAKFRTEVEKIAQNKNSKKGLFRVFDYSSNRDADKMLEGTGAMVIDRKAKVAYCCLSPRADKELFEQYCQDTGHKAVSFHASQDGMPVYHTNVIMGIGSKSAIICLDSIEDAAEKAMVRKSLEDAGNKIIEITLEQVKLFLGNTLELKGKDGEFLAMSDTAYNALTEEQKRMIEEDTEILHAPIETIEFYGGGSVRCMLAEIFE
ncbi:hypothetical protein LJB88_02915 [Erysipelotrichaceae bacterium OttesenSCG-928-M19]|nr:hypothetical protein [Erysipelotrichaceae bacterium OttesenSCG-928-M19]